MNTIIKAISKYLTEHNIKHQTITHHIIIHNPHTTICHNNNIIITTHNHTFKHYHTTKLHTTDPDLLTKILKLLQ